MSKDKRATTSDLFLVCRQYLSEPVARVAAETLFWSQCKQHKLRGRAGFFKEDSDLVKAIGKHSSSIRRALTRICANAGENRPEAIFEVDYGPRPWERSGRVRWLFRMPRGDEIISEALLLAKARDQKRQHARTDRSKEPRSVMPDWSHPSVQNARIHYKQTNSSKLYPDSLSTPPEKREKPDSNSKEGKFREELGRFVECWNTICHEANEPTLAWLPSDVERLAPRLIEVIQNLGIANLTDDELSKRLQPLCGKPSNALFERMGRSFSDYNPHGLVIDTFARFGPKVWRAMEEELPEATVRAPRLSLQELAISVTKKPTEAVDFERELERLVKTWEEACLARNQQALVWSAKDVETHVRSLRHFISVTSVNKVPNDELLTHLCNIVETVQAVQDMAQECGAKVATSIQIFSHQGIRIFRLSQDGQFSAK